MESETEPNKENNKFSSTMFNNALQVLSSLRAKAKVESAGTLIELGYPITDPEESVLIYRGFSTKDAEDTRLLASSVSHAMRLLKAMRALTLLKTGSRGNPSIYLIHYTPTVEQFEAFRSRSFALERQIAPNSYESMVNSLESLRIELHELRRRVEDLERNTVVRHNI